MDLTNRAAGPGLQSGYGPDPALLQKSAEQQRGAAAVFLSAVADQAKIPLIIYNWPQTTGIDISAEQSQQLSEHPNIIAIKESSGNLEKVLQMLREVLQGFSSIRSGPRRLLAPSLAVGAVGAVLAFANAAPYAAISIWEAHRRREPDAAKMDWQNRIGRPSALVTTKYGIPGLKYAMELAGYYGGPPRLPLTPLGPAAKKEIDEALRICEDSLDELPGPPDSC